MSDSTSLKNFNSRLMSPTENIRAATRSLHECLELSSVAQRLMSTDLTLAAYLDILEVWVFAWDRIEESIVVSPFSKDFSWMPPNKRSALGHRELVALKAKYGLVLAQKKCPSTTHFPISPTVGALAGTCYVMRGAALGGKVIGKHLRNTLALPDTEFASFYTADAPEKKQWCDWLKACDIALNSSPLVTQAISGARDTYTFLLNQFRI